MNHIKCRTSGQAFMEKLVLGLAESSMLITNIKILILGAQQNCTFPSCKRLGFGQLDVRESSLYYIKKKNKKLQELLDWLAFPFSRFWAHGSMRLLLARAHHCRHIMGVKNEPLSPKLLRSLGNLLLEHNLTDIVVLAANISIQCPAGVD